MNASANNQLAGDSVDISTLFSAASDGVRRSFLMWDSENKKCHNSTSSFVLRWLLDKGLPETGLFVVKMNHIAIQNDFFHKIPWECNLDMAFRVYLPAEAVEKSSVSGLPNRVDELYIGCRLPELLEVQRHFENSISEKKVMTNSRYVTYFHYDKKNKKMLEVAEAKAEVVDAILESADELSEAFSSSFEETIETSTPALRSVITGFTVHEYNRKGFISGATKLNSAGGRGPYSELVLFISKKPVIGSVLQKSTASFGFEGGKVSDTYLYDCVPDDEYPEDLEEALNRVLTDLSKEDKLIVRVTACEEKEGKTKPVDYPMGVLKEFRGVDARTSMSLYLVFGNR